METTSLEQLNDLFEKKQLHGMFLIENDVYHSAPGLSRSSLDDLSNGLKYFQWKLVNKELTESLIFGSAFHCKILEPKKFDSTFYLTKTQPRDPQLDKDGRQPLAERHLDTINGMIAELKKDPLFEKMTSGIIEHSFFWTDSTGALLKAKPDVILPMGVVVDWKTTQSVNMEEFSKSIFNYRYHSQAAMILDGIRLALEQSGQKLPEGYAMPDAFVIAAVEKSDPHDYEFFQLGPQSIVVGEAWYREQLKKYVMAVTENNWNPQKKIIEIEIPQWAISKEML